MSLLTPQLTPLHWHFEIVVLHLVWPGNNWKCQHLDMIQFIQAISPSKLRSQSGDSHGPFMCEPFYYTEEKLDPNIKYLQFSRLTA